jgi:hypothetical protein
VQVVAWQRQRLAQQLEERMGILTVHLHLRSHEVAIEYIREGKSMFAYIAPLHSRMCCWAYTQRWERIGWLHIAMRSQRLRWASRYNICTSLCIVYLVEEIKHRVEVISWSNKLHCVQYLLPNAMFLYSNEVIGPMVRWYISQLRVRQSHKRNSGLDSKKAHISTMSVRQTSKRIPRVYS